MKCIFLSILLFFSCTLVKGQLWYEDFTGEANGAQSGTAGGTLGGTWSVTTDPGGTFQKQGNSFQINNTGGEGTWASNVMDISSVGYALIDVGVLTIGFGFTASDYLRFYYRIDGGPETLFSDVDGSIISVTTEASAIVAGNTVQLIIKGVDNSFFGIIVFDDVTVTAAPIIYSRKSGTWTDVTGGVNGTGTWSLTGHTGNACGCYPLNTQVAVIGGNDIVTLPSSQNTVGTPPTTNLAPGAVDVVNTGTLQFNTSGVTLGLQQGLFRVRSGGTVNSSGVGITGEQISFNADIGGASFQVDAGGTASIEDLVLAAGATNFHYLAGGGTLSITDDIIINADGGSLINNRSATFTVTDDLDFNAANSSFTNNGTMTIADDITVDATTITITNSASSTFNITDDLNFNGITNNFSNSGTTTVADIVATDAADDDNVITNASGATLNVGGINAASSEMDILNSGTINQSGNFTNIETADTNFDNLATGIWNWTLQPNTTYDTDIATILNLTAIGNTFNYNAAGAQRIIPTTYHHIRLSTSGAKDANNAAFSVQGNWTVSGTATFTEGTSTITFNGTTAQTITNPAGETFSGLVINNSFAASPQITLSNAVTVSGTLTMSDGNIDLNGTTFTITTLSHAGADTNGWMYGGTISRTFPSTAIAIGNVAGMFPIGNSAYFRPFFLGKNNVLLSNGTITVSYTDLTTVTNVTFADGASTVTRIHNASWNVAKSGLLTTGSWLLRAGGTGFIGIGNINDLRLTKAANVTGIGTAGVNSGTPADFRVNRTAGTAAGLNNSLHIATVSIPTSPLPIELLSFSAGLENNQVALKWTTASETNNDYFTVERATDLEQFEPLIEEDGQGTTKEIRHYKTIDPSPLYGRSYYRLKQTDFDGEFSYSSIRVIDYEGPEFATLTAFPNPATSKNLTIRIEGLKDATEVPLQIVNARGQMVYQKTIKVKTPGTLTEEISRDKFLPSGLYIIKAGKTLYLTQKIVVE